MALRSGWEQRTAAYRSRLIGAGRSGKLTGQSLTPEETRAYWESGGDLRSGRGRNHLPRAKGAAPKEATDRESVGMGNEQTYAELQKWRKKPPSRGGPPAWLPKDETKMGTDTVAILSQIDIPPKRWKTVDFAFLPSGMVVVTITPKRGYDRVVVLPDGQSASEFGRLLRSPALMASSPQQRKALEKEWKRKRGDGIDVTTGGCQGTLPRTGGIET